MNSLRDPFRNASRKRQRETRRESVSHPVRSQREGKRERGIERERERERSRSKSAQVLIQAGAALPPILFAIEFLLDVSEEIRYLKDAQKDSKRHPKKN